MASRPHSELLRYWLSDAHSHADPKFLDRNQVIEDALALARELESTLEQYEVQRDKLVTLDAEYDRLKEQFEALLKVAEGMFQMIDRETWRATGGDDQQGHYEGDYRAAQIEEYLVGLRASNPAGEPKEGA